VSEARGGILTSQEKTASLIETVRALAKQGITLYDVQKKLAEGDVHIHEIEGTPQ
jgi:hypothetical protein